ncbi:MAG: DinB family protein [Candidatus Acidiferrales bacterium]
MEAASPANRHHPVAPHPREDFVPVSKDLIREKPQMLEVLASSRRETIAFLEENREHDLRYYRFPHPFLGSFHLYDWFRFLSYHELRHTKQMQKNVNLCRS